MAPAALATRFFFCGVHFFFSASISSLQSQVQGEGLPAAEDGLSAQTRRAGGRGWRHAGGGGGKASGREGQLKTADFWISVHNKHGQKKIWLPSLIFLSPHKEHLVLSEELRPVFSLKFLTHRKYETCFHCEEKGRPSPFIIFLYSFL